ncbi:MAG: exonuclease SbcCD subunit D [Armatimonadota bacterium]|nr:exonuclease SbcCD subunit D [Armatimonadota bacterium]
MRLAHFSDSHLGHMRFNKVVPETGVNQREQDTYDAFERAIDGILEAQPDVVVHTGDLFDSPRPSNRALYHAVRQIRRLVERDIPLVLISGNHSTPRLRATGSLFALLHEFLPAVHAAYASEYEKLVVGETAFHAIPHCFTEEELKAQVERVTPDPQARYNVALLHVGIAGFREFRMAEPNEQLLSETDLPQGMDYICLGHYHKHTKVVEGAWYAGSLERFSFGEAHDRKGFCLVDLDERQPRFVAIPTRPMIDLDPIDAAGMDATELLATIEGRLARQSLEGAMVRLRVRNCSPAAQGNLDLRAIRERVANALSFNFRWEREGEVGATEVVEGQAFGTLEEEWRRFMQSAEVHGRDRELLTRGGLEYLAAARPEEEPDAPDLSGS